MGRLFDTDAGSFKRKNQQSEAGGKLKCGYFWQYTLNN